MALEDLSDLFGTVDGFVDDAMEYGVLAFSAVATNVGFTAGVNWAIGKYYAGTGAPVWMTKYAIPGAGLVLGAALPTLVGMARPSFRSSNAVKGAAIGLMSAGLMMAVRSNTSLPLAGLGAPEDEALLGLGEDLYQKYLGETTVESVNGLAATTIEESSVNGGLANWNVESVSGGVASAFA